MRKEDLQDMNEELDPQDLDLETTPLSCASPRRLAEEVEQEGEEVEWFF